MKYAVFAVAIIAAANTLVSAQAQATSEWWRVNTSYIFKEGDVCVISHPRRYDETFRPDYRSPETFRLLPTDTEQRISDDEIVVEHTAQYGTVDKDYYFRSKEACEAKANQLREARAAKARQLREAQEEKARQQREAQKAAREAEEAAARWWHITEFSDSTDCYKDAHKTPADTFKSWRTAETLGMGFKNTKIVDKGDEVDVIADDMPVRSPFTGKIVYVPRIERFFKTESGCKAVAQKLQDAKDKETAELNEKKRIEDQKLDKYR